MGADIHGFVEVKKNNKWVKLETPHFTYYDGKRDMPFDWRNYAIFGFLADVRNYSKCEVICEPKGLPDDSLYLNEKEIEFSSYFPNESKRDDLLNNGDYHSHSYLTLSELLAFDYSKNFWDRRIIKQISENGWTGAALAEEGEGNITSYRDFLGEQFFRHIEEMKLLGSQNDVRFVFWFDN